MGSAPAKFLFDNDFEVGGRSSKPTISLHASARERLEEIIRRLGLESRLVVLGEPEIALGDCRIEWADGGICRDGAALTAAIDRAVNHYIGARLEAAPKSDIPWRLDQ